MPEKFEVNKNKQQEKGWSLNSERFKEFQEKIKTWKTVDGEDYCPECWSKYLQRYKEDPEFYNIIKSEVFSLAEKDIAQTRRCAEGWLVICAGVSGDGCDKEIFISAEKKD